jgi:hypothetical protein
VQFTPNFHVDQLTQCWVWDLGTNDKGYGRLRWDGKAVLLSRLAASFFLEGFDLDSPLCVLHHCDNPPCFNPDHLYIGTRLDNARDAMARGQLANRRRRG